MQASDRGASMGEERWTVGEGRGVRQERTGGGWGGEGEERDGEHHQHQHHADAQQSRCSAGGGLFAGQTAITKKFTKSLETLC